MRSREKLDKVAGSMDQSCFTHVASRRESRLQCRHQPWSPLTSGRLVFSWRFVFRRALRDPDFFASASKFYQERTVVRLSIAGSGVMRAKMLLSATDRSDGTYASWSKRHARYLVQERGGRAMERQQNKRWTWSGLLPFPLEAASGIQ
jgi:hypothetical protein